MMAGREALDLVYSYIEVVSSNISSQLGEATTEHLGCNDTIGISSAECIELDLKNRYLNYWLYMEQLEAMNITALKAMTSLIYAIGALANMILVWYILRFKRYNSPTFMLILSLGLSDMGTCLGGGVFTMMVVPTLIGPVWSCALLNGIAGAFYSVSISHLVLFSILRFYQLVFPFSAHVKVTTSFVAKICAILWPIFLVYPSLMLHINPYLKSKTFPYKGQAVSVCEYYQNMKLRHLIMENMYLLIPNALIATFHIMKHIFVRQQARRSVSESQQHTGTRQTTDTRAVTLVVAAFCISSMPQFMHSYSHDVFGLEILSFHHIIQTISLNMIFMNSAVNPFIYVFCASSVRHDVIAMVTCHRRGSMSEKT